MQCLTSQFPPTLTNNGRLHLRQLNPYVIALPNSRFYYELSIDWTEFRLGRRVGLWRRHRAETSSR